MATKLETRSTTIQTLAQAQINNATGTASENP
jgi:hypothetical protein